ncbi:MAG: serine/threonine protein kinase [Myxococcales bacterium]|nr:serine/threonine protein kinase [Myxococcales bacterium]
MGKPRYQALGPLLAGEGSRAFLGLEISDQDTARPVVLVWLPDEATRDPEQLARVRRETEHAATLEHPNIIRVWGMASLDEGTARVVEFADGESLRRILEATKKLPPRYAARVCADSAMGVHFAHEAGNDDGSPLVHGDLRPETLIVSFAGVCKVSGYGALTFAPKEMGGQRVLGRRLHCAPEQVLGGREAFTRPTDIYLIGLCLFECLTGTVPFASEPDFDQAVLGKPLPPIDSEEVPAALKEVVARATAKKAQERFPTAFALKQAIEEAMGNLPTNEDFAAYLREFFPEGERTRAARRQAIDAGIADFARRQWAKKPEPAQAPPPQPAPPQPAPPEASAPPNRAVAPPVAQPTRPPTRPEREVEQDDDEPRTPPRERSSRTTWIAGAALLLAGAGIVWQASRGRERPAAPAPPAPAVTTPAPEPPKPSAVEDAGASASEAPDASAPLAVAPPPEPPKPPPPEPPKLEPPSLRLVTDPAVNLTIDGKDVGRSPFDGPMAPGRHVVRLTDKAKGISASRAVVVRASGKTSEEIVLSKGYVSVSAPEGAGVFIDGKKVGTAPIRGEIPVFEGSHHILVTVGKAKWQQAFSVRAHERMYFNVEAQ